MRNLRKPRYRRKPRNQRVSHLGPTFTRGEAVKFEAMRHVRAFILKDILEKAIVRAIRLISKKKLWRMTKRSGVKVEVLDTLDRVRFMIHKGIG